MRIGIDIGVGGGRQALFEPEAVVALDFVSGRYRVGTGGGSQADFAGLPGLSVTRAAPSTAYAETSTGVLVPFAANVARITDKGLLAEEGRTNYALRSQEFDAGWGGVPTGLSSAAGLAPDGSATAYAWSGGGRLLQDLAAAGNLAYAGSIYIKALSGDPTVTIAVKDRTSDTVRGASGAIAATGTWQRIAATGTTAGGSTGVRLEISVSGGVALIWGAQCEPGAFPTSYIPTTSAAVARAGDDISIGSITQPPRFTMLSEALHNAQNAADQRTLTYSAASSPNSNRITHSRPDPAARVFATAGGSGALDTSVAGKAGARIIKTATSHDGSTYLVAVDGESLGSATAGAPTGLSQLSLGAYFGALYLNGYLRRAALYPRAMNDAELQARTA